MEDENNVGIFEQLREVHCGWKRIAAAWSWKLADSIWQNSVAKLLEMSVGIKPRSR